MSNQSSDDELVKAAIKWSEEQADVFVSVRLSTITPRRVEWLWPGRLPRGKVIVLDGDPGLGKSVLTLDMAARVSTGKPWPDGHDCPGGGVILMSAEDGLEDTIRPRLDAAGADNERIVAFTDVRTDQGKRLPVLPGDVDKLGQLIMREQALLVVIDVLMVYLDGKVNSHRDQDVRRALAPLAELAEATGACIIVIRHLNKNTGSSALHRGGGSIGITGGARLTMIVGADPNDEERRILAGGKSNLSKRAPSLAYRLVETDDTVRVEWLGPANLSADDLVRPKDDDDEPDLPELIRGALLDQGGSADAAIMLKQFRALGFNERTIRRARERAGAHTRKSDFAGGWTWSLLGVDP